MKMAQFSIFAAQGMHGKPGEVVNRVDKFITSGGHFYYAQTCPCVSEDERQEWRSHIPMSARHLRTKRIAAVCPGGYAHIEQYQYWEKGTHGEYESAA
ncbi:hypothetical protein [Streptomyces rectiverticillatus]|uniref:hypothetical protein n=1 Tax=Streptomyces rectiverticillatus TaxID=173860 RepID=UPI0015C3306D|nr:hypothetical protein [Streptomyces rectiverticillatus]